MIVYEEVRRRVRSAGVVGWLSQVEARGLYDLAALSPGPIVEIGTYMGLSTCYLAAPGCRPVFTIDPHDPALHNPTQREMAAGRDTADVAQAHWGEVGVADLVTLVRARAADALGELPEAIGLLFLDGDHHGPAVTADLELLAGRVMPGGIVAFHDWGVPGDEDGLWDVAGAATAWAEACGSDLAAGPFRTGSLAWYVRAGAPAPARGKGKRGT